MRLNNNTIFEKFSKYIVFSRCWAMLLHHFTSVSAIGMIGYFDFYHGFGSFGLLMEVNSIFLNFRHLLKILKQCNTRVYRINSILNIFTLITFRIMKSGKIFI